MISVDPVGGTKLAPDGSITVLVSQGHAPVNVPDVSKGSYQQAAAVLKALHLKPVRGKDVFDNVIPAGQVVSTLPAAGLPARVRIRRAGIRVARADHGHRPEPVRADAG